LVRQTAAADQAAGYAPQDLERLKALADDLGRAPLEFLPTP
jgi:hypothetical protein